MTINVSGSPEYRYIKNLGLKGEGVIPPLLMELAGDHDPLRETDIVHVGHFDSRELKESKRQTVSEQYESFDVCTVGQREGPN